MRVDGVDPLELNKIQDPGQRKQAGQARETSSDTRTKQREQALGREHYNEATKSQKEKLREEIERLNEAADLFNIELRFNVHEDSDRMMVQVYDRIEDKVIREIPPERVLNLVAQIQNMIGVLIDERR